MRRLTTDDARLAKEFGMLTCRWERYEDLGDLPFGAMWCVVPPGAHGDEDRHPEVELAVVVDGSAVIESSGTKLDAPLGSAVLISSHEPHVVHNRSERDPLRLLSLYWMPEGMAERSGERNLERNPERNPERTDA